MAARNDLTTDPQLRATLLLARRGQAWFGRALRQLPDRAFEAPSRIDGWNRAAVIAAVGLHARALASLADAAADAAKVPLQFITADISDQVAYTATLPTQALRNLSDHAAVHLSVSWRDLHHDQWSRPLMIEGRKYRVADVAAQRANVVWWAALDIEPDADSEVIPQEAGARDGGAWASLVGPEQTDGPG